MSYCWCSHFAVISLFVSTCAIAFYFGLQSTVYTEAESVRSMTPLTAKVTLPTIDDLRAGCFFVGSRDGINQYICHGGSSTFDDHQGECELSEEFSAYYSEPVFCCKRPAR